MSHRVRHHVNPLGLPFQRPRRLRCDVPADGEVDVELGCADAQYLFQRAQAHPNIFFVGIEIREQLVDEVNEKAAALGVSNLRAYFANMNVDLPELFDDGRLARIYLNFPDPWFKKRHHKRRVVNAELVAQMAAKLRPSGELLFQSDIYELALEAMAELEESSLRNVVGPWSFLRPQPYSARSLREERCEERGLRIWRILYRKA